MRKLAALCLLLPALLIAQQFAYVLGKQRYPESTNAKPAKAGTTIDNVFHVPVTRITDRGIDHIAMPGITNEYSRSDPSNMDGTRLLLLETETGNWLLYNARKPYNKIRKIGGGLGGDIEPRWDPRDPNTFYAFRGPALVRYDIRNNKVTVVRNFGLDFPAAAIAGTGGEGEPSEDFRWWTILLREASGRPVAVVVFDNTTRTIFSRKTSFEYDLDQTEINWVSTCPLSGDPILGWTFRPERDPFGSQHRGAIRYDKNWNKVADTLVDGHADTAVGINNEELLIYQNNANDFVEMVNLRNAVRTRLFKIPFPFSQNSTLNLHFSGNILSTSPRKGWALVVADEPDGRNNSWNSNQVFLVQLKNAPRIWRLAYNRNLYTGEYFTESFATLSRDGGRVYFQSNWGNPASAGLLTDEYVLDLPPLP